MTSPPLKPASRVAMKDVRRIIFENFNEVDIRFSNEELANQLNSMDLYRPMNLDVLDLEDLLLEMEKSGALRPIAQNFNTRYYKLHSPLQALTCKNCNFVRYQSSVEEIAPCPQCGSGI